MRIRRSMILVLLTSLAACSDIESPVAVDDPSFAKNGTLGKVNGGGHYSIDLGGGLVLSAQFAMSGHQTDADETATGNFHHRTELFGEAVDFSGTFTCLSIDAEAGRAWIGGVITQNRSEREPFASGEIYQPGRDIWFRVVDNGQPSQGIDRTTFVGFEGGGGIITSKEYCDARIWPDGDARTNPLTSGNLKVMP